jgi:hypothetical protein
MSIRSCCQCLVHINTQEPPVIPPFGLDQPCADDEIVDVMLFATPPEWLCEMDPIGFDPSQHNSMELLRFMENCEAVEIGTLNDAAPVNVAPGWHNIVGNVCGTLGRRSDN